LAAKLQEDFALFFFYYYFLDKIHGRPDWKWQRGENRCVKEEQVLGKGKDGKFTDP